MHVKRITPVLLVKEIEPLIAFWVDRLGFTKAVEVPDGSKLGFVIFQKGSVEVMYQTYASVEKDAPAGMASEARKGPTYLYMEVDNLDAVLAAMKDVRTAMPVRTTVTALDRSAGPDRRRSSSMACITERRGLPERDTGSGYTRDQCPMSGRRRCS